MTMKLLVRSDEMFLLILVITFSVLRFTDRLLGALGRERQGRRLDL